MFEYLLPIDLEREVYSRYYSVFVLPDLMGIITKRHFSRNVLPQVVEYSIMEQAARVIRSVYDDGFTEYYKLDAIFYHLVSLHNNKIFDIFD